MSRDGLYVRTSGVFSAPAKPPRGTPIYYADPVATRRLDENSTTFTLTNSTTETTVSSLTMPALTIASTGAARYTASGTVLCKSTAASARWRVKIYDGVTTHTVSETSAIALSSSTQLRRWNIEGYVLGIGTDIQHAWTWLDVSDPSTSVMAPLSYTGIATSTAGINDGAAITVSVTAALSTASTGFTLARKAGVLEGVN